MPIFRNSDINLLFAVAEGGSDIEKAACWPSVSFRCTARAALMPSRMTTSWAGSEDSDWVKRGAGLLPYFAMYSTEDSMSIELGISRRSLPYRDLDVWQTGR